MERLTERFDGWVMRKGCHGPCRTCNGAECADIYPMIDRLAAYEDTGMMSEQVADLKQAWDMYGGEDGITAMLDELERLRKESPNAPMTLEELREMDGEPVLVCDWDGSYGTWALVDAEHEVCQRAKGGFAMFDGYNKTWLAYHRKPKEGTT